MQPLIFVFLLISMALPQDLLAEPAKPEDFYQQVIKLLSEDRFEEALALSQACIEKYPSECGAYKYLMRAGRSRREGIGKTLLYLERRQSENPGNACIEYARGYYYSRLQRQYERALQHLQTAIKISPDFYGSYLEIGWIHHSYRAYEAARKAYEEAINLAKKTGDLSGETESGRQLAILYLHYGNPAKALNYLHEALNLSRRAKRQDMEASILVRMADAYLELDEVAEAEARCRSALKIDEGFNSIGLWYDYRTLGNIYVSAGNIQSASGELERAYAEYQKAIAAYEQALRLARSSENKLMLLSALGDAYQRMGDGQNALQVFNSLLAEAPEGNRSLTGSRSEAKGNIAKIYWAKGQYDRALLFLNQAVDLAKADRNKRMEMSWIKRAGDVYAGIGDYAKARERYDAVLREVKDGFLELGPRNEGYVFFEEEPAVYEAMVDLLLKMHQREPQKNYAREAFDYMEKAKAQSILQALFQNRIVEKLLQEDGPDEYRSELARLMDEVQSTHRARMENQTRIGMVDKTSGEMQNLENEIKKAEFKIEDRHRQIVNLIRRKLRYFDPSHFVESLQQRVLQSNEALIEYLVAEEKTYAFLITQKTFHHFVIPMGRRAFKEFPSGEREKVKSLRQMLRSVSPLFPLANEARPRQLPALAARWADIQLQPLNDLYKAIFQPLEKYLPAGGQLTIVPDDVLYHLPFDMLVTRWEAQSPPAYLLAHYPISYAYSSGLILGLTTMSEGSQSAAQEAQHLLLIANPDFGQTKAANGRVAGEPETLRPARRDRLPQLPFSEEEVHRIAQLVGNAEKLVGAHATKAEFKKRAPRAGIIHLATHGIFDRQNYLDSSLVFSRGRPAAGSEMGIDEEGMLPLHEIMNLRLSALMVVLTGCETGLGRLRRGEGLEGLSRAFLSAGVPSVVGTLWPVADSEAMSDLMSAFYKYLAEGTNKREALQKAKLALLAEGRHTDPFYWAPTILIGDAQALNISRRSGFTVESLVIALLLLIPFFYFTRNRWFRKPNFNQGEQDKPA